jgi:hypothetical protein
VGKRARSGVDRNATLRRVCPRGPRIAGPREQNRPALSRVGSRCRRSPVAAGDRFCPPYDSTFSRFEPYRRINQPRPEGARLRVSLRRRNVLDWWMTRVAPFNYVLFPRPGITLKRPQGKHSPERYTHGGLSMAECMIPLIVMGPKIKFEPAFDLIGIRFDGVLSEGQPLEIIITARAKVSVNEELLIQLQVDAGLDDIQARKEVFSGTEHEYRVRWTPGVNDLTSDEQTKGKMVKQVTAIASYRWQNRTLRTTAHATIGIQLDTTRIRRRLDSKLDSIMGMVPAGLR